MHEYAGWRWHGSSLHRELKLGSYGTPPNGGLDGRADHNWYSFRVTEVVGWAAEATGDRATGQPGGPLKIDLRDHTYWRTGFGCCWTGYSMQVQGWLQRVN